jgi:hypothetical protein
MVFKHFINLFGLLIYLSWVNLSFCQVDQEKKFILMKDGEVIYPNKIEYRKPEMRLPYLFVDSLKFEMKDVQFFKTNEGLYGSYDNKFGKCVINGNIRIYSFENKTNIILGSNSGTTPIGLQNGLFKVNQSDGFIHPNAIFNTNLDELKKANFVNLKGLLISNPKSFSYLKKYRRTKITESIFYTIAIGSLLYSSTFFFKDDNSLESSVKAIRWGGIGVIMMFPSLGLTIRKNKMFRKAIKSYNGVL